MRSCIALKCQSPKLSIVLHGSLRYDDAIHNEFVFLLISDPPGSGGLVIGTYTARIRSSVPFGADASPAPHGGRGQCSSISSGKSRNAPASRVWDRPSPCRVSRQFEIGR